jgi:hypothetical protein
MFGGSLTRHHAMQGSVSSRNILDVTRQQTLRTASDVTVLLGGMLLCLGMLTGAKLLARPVQNSRRRRARQPAPASERAFAERLTQYLEEGPTPAKQATRGSARSFFVALAPGPRQRPKSPSLIREILMRIHLLLRGSN